MIRPRNQVGHVEVEVEEARKDVALGLDGIYKIARAQGSFRGKAVEVSLVVGHSTLQVLAKAP